MDASIDAIPATGGISSAGGESAGGQGSGVGGTGPIPDGIFDPREVYLFGTLSEGECYFDAIAHWSTPDLVSTGFDCDVFGGAIEPRSGQFVFETSRSGDMELLAFVPDGSGVGEYPQDPHSNDRRFGTVCTNPRRFFVDPSGGEVVYQCYGEDPCVKEGCYYYDESGDEYDVPEGYYLLHRGFDGTALFGVASKNDKIAVRDKQGVLHPAVDHFHAKAVRAHPDGFWVVIGHARWNLAFDGSFSEEGTYPEPPPWSEYYGACALEASGASVCFGRSTDVPAVDHVIRAELGADVAEVVYTEASDPLLRLQGSALITGP